MQNVRNVSITIAKVQLKPCKPSVVKYWNCPRSRSDQDQSHQRGQLWHRIIPLSVCPPSSSMVGGRSGWREQMGMTPWPLPFATAIGRSWSSTCDSSREGYTCVQIESLLLWGSARENWYVLYWTERFYLSRMGREAKAYRLCSPSNNNNKYKYK